MPNFGGFFFFFSFVLLHSSRHPHSLCFPFARLRSGHVQLRFVFQRQWHSSLCCVFWFRERSNQQLTWTSWSLLLLEKCLWQNQCMEPPVPGNAFAVLLTRQERKWSKINFFFFLFMQLLCFPNLPFLNSFRLLFRPFFCCCCTRFLSLVQIGLLWTAVKTSCYCPLNTVTSFTSCT